jgi:hypothetical protein
MSWLDPFNVVGGTKDLLFGSGDEGFNAANPYIEQAMAEIRKYMGPYHDIGVSVAPGLQNEYSKLMSDPAAMLEFFMEGYEPSKEYQFKQEQMGQSAANTAAAGGMRGSPLDQYHQQEITNSLLNADMQKYLGNVTGLYSQGLGGNQGLYNTGFNAANSMSSDLANLMNSQGSLAYNAANQKRQNFSQLLGMGLGLGSMFI